MSYASRVVRVSKFPTKHILFVLFVSLFLFEALSAGSKTGPDSPALIAKLDCPDRVASVAFSPDGKLLAAAFGWNGPAGIRIWSVGDRRIVYSWESSGPEGDHKDIRSVAFSPNGKIMVAANWNGDVFSWSTAGWGQPAVLIRHAGSPTGLAFSSDSSLLLFTSEKEAMIYDFRAASYQRLLSIEPGRSFYGGGFSADGTKFLICNDANIQVWDTGSRAILRTWPSQSYGFFCSLSPQRNFILPGGWTTTKKNGLEIHSVADGKSIGQISGLSDSLYASAVSHSESFIALAGGSYGGHGDLALWDLGTFKELGYESFGEMPIQSVTFSPDDTLLAAGSDDGFVLLYSVDLLRGPQTVQQPSPLCGEVLTESQKTFIVPVSEVPPGFDYAWKFEITEPANLGTLAGHPIALLEWSIETTSSANRVRVRKFQPLLHASATKYALSNFVIFGDIQNPGWNKGAIVKIYGDGSFVATNNPGACLAYGALGESTPIRDFESLKSSLLKKGLVSLAKLPLTRQYPHFRTRFIRLNTNGVSELRTDAEVVDFSNPVNHPTKKEAEFDGLFMQYESFLDILRNSSFESSH
jgi:hypothetical protein